MGSLVARGGTSSVYAATDLVLRRPVALKLLDATDETDYSRFVRAAQIASRFAAASIVPIHDMGGGADQGEPPWVVMPLLTGGSLVGRRIDPPEADGALGVAQTVTLLDGILAALEVLHRHDHLHGDLSPANVLLDDAGIPWLIDIGLDRRGITRPPGTVRGTPGFVPPERVLGQRETERSDLYSVGCLMFCLVTGQPPFEGESALAIAAQGHRPPPRASAIRRELPAEVDAFLAIATALEPSDRFPSAAAMRAGLARLPLGNWGVGVERPQQARPRTRELTRADQRPSHPARRPTTRRQIAASRRTGSGSAAVIATLALAAGFALGVLFAPASPAPAETGAVTRSVLTTGPRSESSRSTTSSSVRVLAIPRLEGLPFETARKALSDNGFILGEVTRRHSAARLDTVLATQPVAGSPARPGTVVSLDLATGATVVPDVAGLAADDAVDAFQRAGLQTTVRRIPRLDMPAGSVVASGVVPGTVVQVGTTVALTVATSIPQPTGSPAAPSPLAPSIRPSGTNPPSAQPNRPLT